MALMALAIIFATSESDSNAELDIKLQERNHKKGTRNHFVPNSNVAEVRVPPPVALVLTNALALVLRFLGLDSAIGSLLRELLGNLME